jgi:hypothetical protein
MHWLLPTRIITRLSREVDKRQGDIQQIATPAHPIVTMPQLRKFVEKYIVLHPHAGSFTSGPESARWSNKDLDPVPQEKKTWEWWQ